MADRTRRGMLAATAASLPLLALSSCKGVGALAAPPAPAPDVGLLQAAITAEELMIARYDAAIKGTASLAHALTPLRTEHHLHLAALRARLVVPPGSAAAQQAARQAAQGGLSRHRPKVPAGPAAAVSFLQAAEKSAAAALLRKLPAVPPSLAQLLASVAASESTHVAALAAVTRGSAGSVPGSGGSGGAGTSGGAGSGNGGAGSSAAGSS
ncbi:MAG: hypothetical protein ABJB47_23540 [Actinomycetota bacterium]